MHAPTKQRTTLTRLVAELRTLPDGLATPVRADFLLTDALEALGWPASGVAELLGVDVEAMPSGAVAVVA